MKIIPTLFFAVPLITIRLAAGAPVISPANATPIGIVQTVPADFPPDLARLGIIDGWAKLVVGIDEQGRLLDALTIGYSHPQFATAAAAALTRWNYRAATIGGQPIATVTQLDFNFHHDCGGARIVTLTTLDFSDQLKLKANKAENKLCSLAELDSAPIPTHLIAPAYSDGDIRRNAGKTVVVGFYIDETGCVRLPTIAYADDVDVAKKALAAVEQWRFEPPKSKQRPVITKARQVFVFKAPAD